MSISPPRAEPPVASLRFKAEANSASSLSLPVNQVIIVAFLPPRPFFSNMMSSLSAQTAAGRVSAFSSDTSLSSPFGKSGLRSRKSCKADCKSMFMAFKVSCMNHHRVQSTACRPVRLSQALRWYCAQSTKAALPAPSRRHRVGCNNP